MFNVVIHVSSEDPYFAHLVEKQGLRVTYKKGSQIKVLLTVNKKGIYEIPEILFKNEHSASVLLEENYNDYFAQIICSHNGKKIKPAYRKSNRNFFYIFRIATIVTVSQHKGKREISIDQVIVDKKRNQVKIIERELCSSEQKEYLKNGILPQSLEIFKDPVILAISKLNLNKEYAPPYIRARR